MKLIIRLISVLALLMLASPVVLLKGCGNENIPPDKSTITINPTTVTFTISTSTTKDFFVVVRYPDGKPMPYANVFVEGPFAVPRANPHYQFYRNLGGELDPNAIAVDSGFTIQTDENGVAHFSITAIPGPFTDAISVYTGTVSASATLTYS